MSPDKNAIRQRAVRAATELLSIATRGEDLNPLGDRRELIIGLVRALRDRLCDYPARRFWMEQDPDDTDNVLFYYENTSDKYILMLSDLEK
jgi:hypothetical protein